MNIKDIKKTFVYVFGGNMLTSDIFTKNIRFILAIFIVFIVFISHGYTVGKRSTEVVDLQRELKDAKFEALTISSNLTEASRLGEIEKMIEKNGLDIKVTNQPVYKIKK